MIPRIYHQPSLYRNIKGSLQALSIVVWPWLVTAVLVVGGSFPFPDRSGTFKLPMEFWLFCVNRKRTVCIFAQKKCIAKKTRMHINPGTHVYTRMGTFLKTENVTFNVNAGVYSCIAVYNIFFFNACLRAIRCCGCNTTTATIYTVRPYTVNTTV